MNALIDLAAAIRLLPDDSHLRGLFATCLQKVGRLKDSITGIFKTKHSTKQYPRLSDPNLYKKSYMLEGGMCI